MNPTEKKSWWLSDESMIMSLSCTISYHTTITLSVQDCSISIGNAPRSLQSHTKPSIVSYQSSLTYNDLDAGGLSSYCDALAVLDNHGVQLLQVAHTHHRHEMTFDTPFSVTGKVFNCYVTDYIIRYLY